MALNPHQKNKVDISQLTEEEQKLFRLYGKLPNKKDLLQNKLKERKYFDSGDYAMSKAGKADAALEGALGREHPSYARPILPPPTSFILLTSRPNRPESIPHLSQQQSQTSSQHPGGSVSGGPSLHPTYSQGQAGSPVKEPSVLQRGMSVDEQDSEGVASVVEKAGEEEKKGVPIRQ
ncbi:hypothetical protein LTR91_015304 [Friedmanniomyces endolithicus]|uniref:mRNA stability protein n=1 Tax=Friedmanniomyces endolithicus TaxID=329885 RepID=A0AAN6QMA3_9PEZI|nr:hypothetical protein LTR75_008809 [Friedmanniomyces endolithicus]KAK0840641.1 hypothetical protein LTR03_010440 [Friedmanniomyces endolithicus]KAK0845065.1 hypothetical protein LTS02_015439 [Friedmanniomyces endolithicus]KAK0901877.1 hypothetical protein LTR57_019937 [Friedmanniomyces endolithicus]KAK0903395.1 hypothetical protein LTR02_007620 [Friedmanniomyces endolithicus]